MGHGTLARNDSTRGKKNFSCTGKMPRNKGSGNCTNTCGCLVDSKRLTRLSNDTLVDSLNDREGQPYNRAVKKRWMEDENAVHIAPNAHLKCYRCLGNHLVKYCVVKRGRRGNRRGPGPGLMKQSGVESSCRDSGVSHSLHAISMHRRIRSDISNVNDVKFAKMSDTYVAKEIECHNRTEIRMKQLGKQLDELMSANTALKLENEQKLEYIESLKLKQTQTENRVSLLEDELRKAQAKILTISKNEDELDELNTKVIRLQTELNMNLRTSRSSVDKPVSIVKDSELPEASDRDKIADDVVKQSQDLKPIIKAKRRLTKIGATGIIERASFKVKDKTEDMLPVTAPTTDSRGKDHNNTKGDYSATETRCHCHGESVASKEASRRKKQVCNNSAKNVGSDLDDKCMDKTSTPSMEDERTYVNRIREYNSSRPEDREVTLVRTQEIRRSRHTINKLDSHMSVPHSPRQGDQGRETCRSVVVESKKIATRAGTTDTHKHNVVIQQPQELGYRQRIIEKTVDSDRIRDRGALIENIMKLLINK